MYVLSGESQSRSKEGLKPKARRPRGAQLRSFLLISACSLECKQGWRLTELLATLAVGWGRTRCGCRPEEATKGSKLNADVQPSPPFLPNHSTSAIFCTATVGFSEHSHIHTQGLRKVRITLLSSVTVNCYVPKPQRDFVLVPMRGPTYKTGLCIFPLRSAKVPGIPRPLNGYG